MAVPQKGQNPGFPALVLFYMCLLKNRLVKTEQKRWREPGCGMEMSGCSRGVFWWGQVQSLTGYPQSTALPFLHFFAPSPVVKGVPWPVPTSHSFSPPPCTHVAAGCILPPGTAAALPQSSGPRYPAFLSNLIISFSSLIIRRWNAIRQELTKVFPTQEGISLPTLALRGF